MSRSLCPSDVVTDSLGVHYQRIAIRGNGFCGYNSLSFCLMGTEGNHESVIEDCANVFTNCPE